MRELVYLDAVEIASLYRNKQLSPYELMQAVIERSEEINPSINALSTTSYDRALLESKKLEQAFLEGQELGVLAGIPIVTKEKHAISGETISHGLNLSEDPIAEESHVIIDRILGAGGIIHSRATTPEFSCATFTQSTRWGITRNPFNLSYSPGGSSGGSAAALAAGMATLATASDIGGSTRLPASFTATVGYKPSYGKIPGMGVLAVDHYRSDGPLGRSVRDVALLTNVMAGIDFTDHASHPHYQDLSLSYDGDLKGKRIALCMRLGNFHVAPDIEKNTRKIAKILESAGAIVEEIELPWTSQDIMQTAAIHYAHILIPGLKESLAHVDSYADYIDSFIQDMENLAKGYSYFDGLQREYIFQQQLMNALEGFDALICPASAIVGLEAGKTYLNGITMHNGEHLKHYWEAHMAVPFNIANRMPVLSVPSGIADCGVPTGIQIVGKPWCEQMVFDIGHVIERLQPWQHLWQQIKV